MCGIVGFITNETRRGELSRSKFLRQGLIIDTLRGDDSTGVFAVGHEPLYDDGSAYWLKALGPGQQFVEDEDYWKNLYDVSAYRCCVGHNRAATLGAVAQSNAHPFQEGPITLVHNGTLRSTHMMPFPMYKLKDDGIEVDSHAIAANLARTDLDKQSEVLEELRGAYALVWHDARDDSINIVRNDERPLHFGMSRWDDTLYFMSEGPMLDFMDVRLKLGIEGMYYPKPHQWLKWLPDTPLASPYVEEIVPAPSYTYPSHGVSSDWGGYGAGHGAYGAYYDDDDDYDWKPTPPKAEPPLPRDSWIHVGGRKQPVPQIHQEGLLELGMLVEDRLEFVPEAFTERFHKMKDGKKAPQGSMYGTITTSSGEEVSCLLLTVHKRTSEMMDRSWLVRPIGVTFREGTKPIALAKLVRLRFRAPSLTSEISSDKQVVAVEDGKVMGPWGQRITRDEWLARTVSGCEVCGRALNVSDADDIIWSKDGTSPHCGGCATYTIDEDGVIVMH